MPSTLRLKRLFFIKSNKKHTFLHILCFFSYFFIIFIHFLHISAPFRKLFFALQLKLNIESVFNSLLFKNIELYNFV